MEHRPGRYVSHIWYVNSPENKDWLAHLWKDPDGPWHIEYRFRYYVDEDNGIHSKDRKSWYDAEVKAEVPEAEVVEKIDLLANITRDVFQGELWKLPVQSDDPRVALEIMKKQPWCHMTFLPAPN